MSHIFGLEHSLGGILGQAGSLIGSIATNPFSSFGMGGDFATPSGGSPGFSTELMPVTPASTAGRVTRLNGCKSKTTETCVVVDNATGAVISTREVKHRRRRKRLATRSDIADLAALKSILGGGKALDAWIATRGGR